MRLIVLALLAVFLVQGSAHSQQINSGAPLIQKPGTESGHVILAAADGGFFMAWNDDRAGTWDVFVQRFGPDGQPNWSPLSGIPVGSGSGSQTSPVLVSDGAGGVIVAWFDTRVGWNDIYAQRLSSTGVALWQANGVAVCAIAAGSREFLRTTTDGAGGLLATWSDTRNTGTWDIWIQRITAVGTPFWASNGVQVTNVGGTQYSSSVISDGASGAYVAWQDNRSDANDIYAQHVLSSGAAGWTLNGVIVSNASASQLAAQVHSDNAGGVTIAWLDERSGTSAIFAQRLSSAGVTYWTPNGVPVATPSGWINNFVVSGFADGSLATAWSDARSGTSNYDVFAQRLGTDGSRQWATSGVPVCISPANQLVGSIATLPNDSIVVAWNDERSSTGSDVYAQKLTAGGSILWTVNGLAISAVSGTTQSLPLIVPSISPNAFVVWADYRYGQDLYGQLLAANGDAQLVDPEPPVIAYVRDVPNDQGGKVKVAWSAAWLEVAGFVTPTRFDLWRSVPSNALIHEGNLASQRPRVYGLAGTDLYWELVGDQPSAHLVNYSMVTSTTGDSIAGSNPTTHFLVQAWSLNGRWWFSNIVEGYSVDNLTPPAPVPFVAQPFDGHAHLHWAPSTAADFKEFRLYRSADPLFTPGPSNFLIATSDTGHVDSTAFAYYYKLTALDVHGNESAPAVAGPGGNVGIPGPSSIERLWLALSPNPASDGVLVRFGIPREASLRVTVFDIAGRSIRELHDGLAPAGTKDVRWDLRDSGGAVVSNGAYLIRLETPLGRRVSRVAVVR